MTPHVCSAPEITKKSCRIFDTTYRIGRTLLTVLTHTKKLHNLDLPPVNLKAAHLPTDSGPEGNTMLGPDKCTYPENTENSDT